MYISNEDVNIILAARKSFLYHEDEPWVKTNSEDFDIPMGSYDGAECCEIVGAYLLHSITLKSNGILHRESCGIYRDDGLAVVQGGTSECEHISKKLRKLFLKHDLRITTEYGKKRYRLSELIPGPQK